MNVRRYSLLKSDQSVDKMTIPYNLRVSEGSVVVKPYQVVAGMESTETVVSASQKEGVGVR